ncbi:MAG: glucokinase [Desulfovibrio sp.]|nr:glucokinase [Desulfovibrio sp.]
MGRIFAADIGGTNARFARFSCENGRLAPETVWRTGSKSLRDAADVLSAMRGMPGAGPTAGDALAVALAGPVEGLRGSLTNGSLRMDLNGMASRLGWRGCVLLNDFAAEAHATLTDVGARARRIFGPESSSQRGTRAVFGAGTGLGAASLHWFGHDDVPLPVRQGGQGSWHAVPSEVGHAPFPFQGEEEQRYANSLVPALGRDWASVEDVLCGRGLERLHAFLTGRRMEAAEVSREALGDETPTLRWYARFLGRFCRIWICTTLCTGGLWIAGGIAASNPLCVSCQEFFGELTAGSVLQEMIERVPIRLASTTDSGLWGAARVALQRFFTPARDGAEFS